MYDDFQWFTNTQLVSDLLYGADAYSKLVVLLFQNKTATAYIMKYLSIYKCFPVNKMLSLVEILMNMTMCPVGKLDNPFQSI